MTLLSNNKIKEIKQLSDKKFRDKLGLFIVEGDKIFNEVRFRPDWEVVEVFYREDIGNEAMKRISSLSSPSPVLAIVRQKPHVNNFDFYIKSKKGLCLGLDSIRDPGNLGTIIRIADWFGVNAIFASPDTVDMYNPKVVQATMGSIFRVPIFYTNLVSVCEEFKQNKHRVYGTFLDGNNIYSEDLNKEGNNLIIIGNEAHGISNEIKEHVTNKILFPSYSKTEDKAESLNAAIATSLVIAEFKR